MRKLLLASAAMLSASAGLADAQQVTAPPGEEIPAPARTVPRMTPHAGGGGVLNLPASSAGSNNNNNLLPQAHPGTSLIPAPGTFVVRLGGRVNTLVGAGWSSADNFSTPAVAATTGPFTLNAKTGAITNAAGLAPSAAVSATRSKVQPQMLSTYARLYPGLDAMGTNGLRYGAAMEIRMNSGTAVGKTGTSLTGGNNASGQTLYIRRAFGYLAADNAGLLRVGEGDGIIGLFDGGVTTTQNFSISGGLNMSGGLQMLVPAAQIPYPWLSLSAAEYTTPKIVYMSPKFFGFDVGAAYVPSQTNGYDNSAVFPGSAGAPLCSNLANGANTGNSGCSTLSSSSALPDATRYRNLGEVGIRYNGDFGPVSLLAYAAYYGSSKVNYTGVPGKTVGLGGSSASGNYQNLSIGSFGTAVTFAGLTFGANYLTGETNGQIALNPGGAPAMNAVTAGVQYIIGALTVGAVYGQIDSQGSAALVNNTQRHETEFDAGGTYKIAPGLSAYADYYYAQRHQGNFNFQTGAVNTAANNNVHGQAVLLGMAVNW